MPNVFDSNLRALREYQPGAYAVLREFSPVEAVRTCELGASAEAVTNISSIRKTSEAHLLIGSMAQPGAIWLAMNNRSASCVPNWMQCIYVVERDLDVAYTLLCALDLTFAWSDPGVRLFIGPDAYADLADWFDDHPMDIMPINRIDMTGSLSAALRVVDYDRAASAVCDSLRTHDELRSTMERIDDGKPIKVLLLTSMYTTVLKHCTHSMARALRSLGHDVTTLQEGSHFSKVTPGSIAYAERAFEPDAIFLIDSVRSNLGGCVPDNVPFVTWIQDDVPRLAEREAIDSLGPLDIVYALSPSMAESYRERGYPEVSVLPFAVDHEKYSSAPANDTEKVVAFITHIPEQPILHDRRADRIAVADMMLEEGIPVALYGNGWDEIARFRPYARGPVEPGWELQGVYRRSAVVLHVSTGVNMHSRVLEAIASGGFVLARRCLTDWDEGDLCDCLDIADEAEQGSELATYFYPSEFVDIVNRAFGDEAWRHRFILRGQARVARDHGYDSRAKTVLAGIADGIRATLAEED